jgi:hypothetical protein
MPTGARPAQRVAGTRRPASTEPAPTVPTPTAPTPTAPTPAAAAEPTPAAAAEPTPAAAAEPATAPAAAPATAASAAAGPADVALLGRLRELAAFGSPLVLVTGLLFYFGWVRASIEARALGYDIGLLPLSTRDYLLKSVDVLFVPATLLLGAALVADVAGRRVVAAFARRRGEPAAGRLLWALHNAWLPCLVGCVAALAFSPVLRPYAIPGALSLGLLGWYWAGWLARRAGIATAAPARARVVLVAVLLCCALFWDTERLARAVGQGYAADIAADPTRLVAVTVLSDRDLGLRAPGLSTEVRGSAGARLWAYTGLRLVDHSDQAYVLITDDWNPAAGRAILLRAGDGVVLEFSN